MNDHSLLKDVLKDVFKAPIIGFQNGVFSAHVERPFLLDGILKAAVCKACYRLLEIQKRQMFYKQILIYIIVDKNICRSNTGSVGYNPHTFVWSTKQEMNLHTKLFLLVINHKTNQGHSGWGPAQASDMIDIIWQMLFN